MQKTKGALIVNIFVYLWLMQAFVRGAFSSLSEPMSEGLSISYFIMQIAITCVCLICIIGLLLKKEWGRVITIFYNFALVAIVAILPVAMNLFILFSADTSFAELFWNSRMVPAIIAGIGLIAISIILSGKTAKSYFKPKVIGA